MGHISRKAWKQFFKAWVNNKIEQSRQGIAQGEWPKLANEGDGNQDKSIINFEFTGLGEHEDIAGHSLRTEAHVLVKIHSQTKKPDEDEVVNTTSGQIKKENITEDASKDVVTLSLSKLGILGEEHSRGTDTQVGADLGMDLYGVKATGGAQKTYKVMNKTSAQQQTGESSSMMLELVYKPGGETRHNYTLTELKHFLVFSCEIAVRGHIDVIFSNKGGVNYDTQACRFVTDGSKYHWLKKQPQDHRRRFLPSTTNRVRVPVAAIFDDLVKYAQELATDSKTLPSSLRPNMSQVKFSTDSASAGAGAAAGKADADEDEYDKEAIVTFHDIVKVFSHFHTDIDIDIDFTPAKSDASVATAGAGADSTSAAAAIAQHGVLPAPKSDAGADKAAVPDDQAQGPQVLKVHDSNIGRRYTTEALEQSPELRAALAQEIASGKIDLSNAADRLLERMMGLIETDPDSPAIARYEALWDKARQMSANPNFAAWLQSDKAADANVDFACQVVGLLVGGDENKDKAEDKTPSPGAGR